MICNRRQAAAGDRRQVAAGGSRRLRSAAASGRQVAGSGLVWNEAETRWMQVSKLITATVSAVHGKVVWGWDTEDAGERAHNSDRVWDDDGLR